MFERVQPGQRLSIGASTWNAVLGATEAHQRRGKTGAGGSHRINDAGVVLCEATGTTDIERFTVVTIANAPVPPLADIDNYANYHLLRCTYGGVTEGLWLRYGIAQEPIAVGSIGRVMLSGVSPVYVQKPYSNAMQIHRGWIQATASNSVPVVAYLPWGPIEFLETPQYVDGTNYLAYARFPVDIGLVLGITNGTINANGSGTVDICDASGSLLTPTKSITCTNRHETTLPDNTPVMIARVGGIWRIVQANV